MNESLKDSVMMKTLDLKSPTNQNKYTDLADISFEFN